MRRPRSSSAVWFVALLSTASLLAGACGGDDGTAPSAATEADSADIDTTVPPETSTTTSPPTTTPGDSGATTEPTSPTTTATPTTVAPTTAAPTVDGPVVPDASTVADLLALGRPIVAVHAGGDFDAPHSTMFAYAEAVRLGADVLEMDVMLTADEVLIVHHDDTVDRTTETSGVVREMTYAELEVLDNAYWFSGDVWVDQSLPDEAYVWRGVRTGDREPPAGYGPDDFRIETFASVAEAFPAHVLDVEIKVQRDAAGESDLEQAFRTAEVLAGEIERLGRAGSVIVVSFDDRVIDAFRGFAPEIDTSPGLDTLVAWYAGAPVEFAPQDVVFQVPPVFEGIEVLTAETVARAHEDGFAVWAWMSAGEQETVEFYRELIARGVDGLIVARPAAAVEAVTSPG